MRFPTGSISRRAAIALALAGALGLAVGATARQAPDTQHWVTPVYPAPAVTARHGMVVAQEAQAAKIGAAVLKDGGNAVDAAVAVGFAMAVTFPDAGNLGGGGFMVIHRADGENVTIDYREAAPARTTRDVFLDANGNADPHKSRDTGLGVGVPGTVAGLALALRRYGSGRFSLAQLMQPAIRLARDGFPVPQHLAHILRRFGKRLVRWPSSAKIFMRNGELLQAGDRLVQSDLAGTLEAIAKRGPRAFYTGPIAKRIVAAVQAAGGRMTAQDLADYRPVVRRPIRGSYRGYTIVSMPPPSSGGVILVEMLNILEGYDLARMGAGNPEALHLMIEAMKRAYADRAFYLGDPGQVHMPIRGLISKAYAAKLRAGIDPKRARPAADIHRGTPSPWPEGHNTTHFSIVDAEGNAVANTYTLNFAFGLGLVANGTGVLLNNELDDFAAKPMAPNAYGLVGFAANAPGPGKRPLSSMTPTIVLKHGKPVLVTGSPGGSRIITTVLQVILNRLTFGIGIGKAVAFPRLHDQWLPDVVFVEKGFAPATIRALEALGHTVRPTGAYTSANSIAITPNGIVGAADPRSIGALAIGY